MVAMSEEGLLRFVRLVQRELGADDARVELGGRDPVDECHLFVPLPNTAGTGRIVAVFTELPADRDALQRRLQALVDAFATTAGTQAPLSDGAVYDNLVARQLSDELDRLVAKTKARHATIIDNRSPVFWASSSGHPLAVGDVDYALQTAELISALRRHTDLSSLLQGELEESTAELARQAGEELALAFRQWRRGLGNRFGKDLTERLGQYLSAAEAVAAVRRHSGSSVTAEEQILLSLSDPSEYVLAHSVANIYWIVLFFTGTPSELHTRGALLRARGRLERLVASLPPVDPPPSGGRMLQLCKPPPTGEG